jgi:hypothetical protein
VSTEMELYFFASGFIIVVLNYQWVTWVNSPQVDLDSESGTVTMLRNSPRGNIFIVSTQ